MKKENKEDLIKFNGKVYKKSAFIIEDEHPVIGRLLMVEGIKFKIMDKEGGGSERMGTFLARLTTDDEERMKEYDDALEDLSSKLVNKLDVKRLIKENMKNKSMQEIKTGLFILEAQEKGEDVEEEHHRGCYDYKIFYKNQMFQFMSGSDFEPL